MRKLNTALILLGFVFLAYLVWRVGPGALGKQVGALGFGVVLLILAEGAANVAHIVGWRHCIRSPRGRVPLWRLVRIGMAGFAINYLTPTASVGGEVSRANLLASTHGGTEAVSSVILDKLMTGIAHLLLVAVGAVFLFWRVSLPFELWMAMAGTMGLLAAGMAIFLWLQKHGKMGSVCRWLVAHRLGGRSAQRIAEHLSRVDEVLKRFYREHPWEVVLSVAWHVIGHAAALLHVWLFLWLLGQPASLGTVAAAGFLSLWFDLLTFAIPLNLGTLEGSRILVLSALGCQALLGMALGVAVRIAQVFWACFGLASYALLAARKPVPEAYVLHKAEKPEY